MLRGISGVYRTQRDKVTKNVAAIRDALDRMWESHGGDFISLAVNDQAALRLVQEIDRVHGGIGQAPKFPNTSVLELVWRGGKRLNNADLREAVTLTLDRMCQGGIYDHLGGGFARYSTDAEWLVPHFEKMLYDNAQLLDLLLLAWQETRSDLYERRIRETADWVLREMIAEDGGFAATLDADSEGVEGKFYVWTEAEVDAVLGADAASLQARLRRDRATAIGRRRTSSAAPAIAADERRSSPRCARSCCTNARKRVRPGWDDKVLADWNGLMIAALARAGRVFGEQSWIDAARKAFEFVVAKMTRDGRLLHSYRRGEAQACRHARRLRGDDAAARSRCTR